MARGESVSNQDSVHFTWEQAADRIDYLLTHGLYQPQIVVDQSADRDRLELAELFIYLWREKNKEHPHPFFMDEAYFTTYKGFPDESAAIAEALKDPTIMKQTVENLRNFARAYYADKSLLTAHYTQPARVYKRLEKFLNDPLVYPATTYFPPERQFFITRDEIDDTIWHGSHSDERRLKLYSFFIHSHSAKEKTDFLKSEFGESGSSHSISRADDSYLGYEGKGIEFRRGDVRVRMKWEQYARRLQEFVLTGRFLSQDIIDQIPKYHLNQIVREISSFFYRHREFAPFEYPGEQFYDFTKEYEAIEAFIGQKDGLSKVEDAMLKVVTSLSPEHQDYERLMKIYGDISAYRQGKFDLFRPSEELEAEANKNGVTLVVHPFRTAGLDHLEYQYREGSVVFLDQKRYEVGEISGDSIVLRDMDFPLLTLTMERAELDAKLRLDSKNEYLLGEPEPVNTVEKQEETQDIVDNPVEDVNNQTDVQSTDEIEEPEDEGEPLYPYSVDYAPKGLNSDEPYAITDERTGDYVRLGGEIQTFATEEEAHDFIEALEADILAQNDSQTNEEQAERDHDNSNNMYFVGDSEKEKEESEEEVEDDTPTPSDSVKSPSIPEKREKQEAHTPIDYRITDDNLGVGGAKEKFQRNLSAILLVHQLEQENRMATAEEQAVLAQYVGWGGIPQAFDERNTQWTEERNALKAALSPEEYAAARGSTLNAHYTSPVVIREMYAGLERMGFTGGNILEPAMGTGNFFGMIPETLGKNSRLYGVELDAITGKIAKQLYQTADVQVTGFEKTDFSNDFFDVVIGNVPFGNYQVSDRQYDKHHFMIHDYFLAKSLDKLRPGGIMAVITSSGTMDKKDESARRYLAERANLLGAVRLPNNAFKGNAGTSVVTDILFLQKREAPAVEYPDWVQLGINREGFTTNNYFVQHPEMVLGEWSEQSTQYGKMEATIKPIEGADLGQQLRQAIGSIEGKIDLQIQEVEDLEEEAVTIPADPNVKNFSYAVVDNQVYFRENSVMVLQSQLPAATAERIKGMVGIRDCTRKLIDAQLANHDEAEITALQQELNLLYDRFTKKYGLIANSANKRAFSNDSSYCLLRSLEVIDNDGNLERKADMFTKRTIKRSQPVTHVDTAVEALAVSLAEKACVDLGFMSSLMGKAGDFEPIIQELKGVIYHDPVENEWQTVDEYLSGNVREKLRTAEAFAEQHPEYQGNVDALKTVQPKDLSASEIDVRLGTAWIRPEYIQQFMVETFHTPWHLRNKIKVQYSKMSGSWAIANKKMDRFSNVYASTIFGTDCANAYRLLEDALNLRDTRIMRKIYENGSERTELDVKETMLAQQKQDAIREKFNDWIYADPQRRAALVKEYNERFNSIRPREYNGEHITFDGMNPEIKLRKHQLNAVAHILYGQNTLLAHVVGAGKSATRS